MKTIPNQGITLSMNNAMKGALAVGTIPAIWGVLFFAMSFSQEVLVDYVSGGESNQFSNLGLVLGLCLGLAFGLGVFLFTGLSYGGFDVIHHFLLRLILSISKLAPLNFVPFLDYAAKNLNFLQKVGGGYIFIHRMLLEHFAAMDKEAKHHIQDSPVLITKQLAG